MLSHGLVPRSRRALRSRAGGVATLSAQPLSGTFPRYKVAEQSDAGEGLGVLPHPHPALRADPRSGRGQALSHFVGEVYGQRSATIVSASMHPVVTYSAIGVCLTSDFADCPQPSTLLTDATTRWHRSDAKVGADGCLRSAVLPLQMSAGNDATGQSGGLLTSR